MFRLDQKTAIITGGGSGIGKAIATVFAKQGAAVHIIDMAEAGATAVADEITQEGGKAAFHKCDVSKQTEVQQVMDTIANNGPIHIMVNNADIAHIGNPQKTTATHFEQ